MFTAGRGHLSPGAHIPSVPPCRRFRPAGAHSRTVEGSLPVHPAPSLGYVPVGYIEYRGFIYGLGTGSVLRLWGQGKAVRELRLMNSPSARVAFSSNSTLIFSVYLYPMCHMQLTRYHEIIDTIWRILTRSTDTTQCNTIGIMQYDTASVSGCHRSLQAALWNFIILLKFKSIRRHCHENSGPYNSLFPNTK